MFALTIIVSPSFGQVLKGIIGALLGIICACIGMDPITGIPRFTFNTMELMNDINVMPARHHAPEVCNNAVVGGAQIPMLTFGISGSASAAVMLGALMPHGLKPASPSLRNSATWCLRISSASSTPT